MLTKQQKNALTESLNLNLGLKNSLCLLHLKNLRMFRETYKEGMGDCAGKHRDRSNRRGQKQTHQTKQIH